MFLRSAPEGAITRETGLRGRQTAPILADMSPLSNRTVATIGSGVMAEAIIAGCSGASWSGLSR